MTRLARRAQGYLLMAAIFILVVLAGLFVYLLTISTGQVAAVTQDEQATRAYQTARAAIEWGAFHILRNPSHAFVTGTCSLAGGNTTLNQFNAMGAPAGTFTARLSCTRFDETEGGVAVRVYHLVATACNRAACPQNPPDSTTYVEREIQLVIVN